MKGGDVVIQEITERKLAEDRIQAAHLEQSVLAKVGRIISSSLDIDAVYERFAELVRPLVPFDEMGVGLIDLNTQTITLTYTTGESVRGRATGDAVPLSGTFALAVIESKNSLIFHPSSKNDVEERFSRLVPYYDAGLRSFLTAPLIVNDQPIGTLQLLSRTENVYTEHHRAFIESVGAQISGAIANAHLHEERRRAEQALRESEENQRRLAEENAIIAEIGRIISSGLDIEGSKNKRYLYYHR